MIGAALLDTVLDRTGSAATRASATVCAHAAGARASCHRCTAGRARDWRELRPGPRRCGGLRASGRGRAVAGARQRARRAGTSRRSPPRVNDARLALCICDLSDMSSVRSFAAEFAASNDALHVLVNNAGAMLPRRELSRDGIELAFATNMLGPFLLTNMLLALIERSAPARIINVSSGGMYTQALDVDDLQSERATTTGQRCTRAPSARRWSSPSSGRGACRAAAWWCTRCTPAGRTRPGCAPRCRASTGRRATCCARPSRARTRSSGSARRRPCGQLGCVLA